MKTIIFSILLTPSIFSQWVNDESFPLYSEYSYFEKIEYLAPDKPLLFEHERNFILHDENTIIYYKEPGDTTWYMHFFQPGLLKNINIINQNDFVTCCANRLYLTTNGGFSWNQVFDFSTLYSNGAVINLYFKDELNGYAVGTTGGSVPDIHGFFARTTDGGINWTSQIIYGTSECKFIKILNDTTMFIAAFSGSVDRLFKSTDNGVSWVMQNSSYLMYDTHKIYFFDDEHGWALGYYGQIKKTEDGGENWENVSSGSINDYMDCYFITSETGWVVGKANGSDSLTFIKTSDGGNTWTSILNLTTAKQILFVNPDTGYIVTDDHIYKTTNGGGYPINTSNMSKKFILGFSLSQNFPNPFNPTTNIEYQIPNPGFVTLKVYDVLGNEVATLLNEEKPAGSYNVEFNGSLFPSGVYFYKLQSGNFLQVRKMLLLK